MRGFFLSVFRRCATLRRNGVALLDGWLGRGGFGRWRGLPFLLRRLLGVTLLPRQLRSAQLPRPFAELVTHDGLLCVSTTARPSRLIPLVNLSYAPRQNVVHAFPQERRCVGRKCSADALSAGPDTCLSDNLLF